MIRILIVDDHEVVRRGVRSLLSKRAGVDVCGEAVDGRDAITKAQELKPDVITMDISMPHMNGLEATREIRRILPKVQILILSQHDVPEMMNQALNAGANGYVVKSAISTQLVAALDKVQRGDPAFEATATSAGSQVHMDVQEIVQRSQTFEKALRESEARLRDALGYNVAVMNNMVEGLYTVDTNGLVTYINRAAEEILGWKREELLGKKMHDVTHYKHPDGSPYPASDCPGLKVLQTGVELRECGDAFIRKDGTFLPVVFSASPLKREGKVAGIVVGFRDDTEQRRAREAIRESEERLRLAQHVARVGTFEWNIKTGVNRWTPELEAMYGLPTGGFSGTQPAWEQLVHPEDRAAAVRWVGQAMEEGRFEGEWRVVWPDGSVHHLIGRGWVFKDEKGRPERLVGVNIDVTERKLMEANARNTEEQLQLALEASNTALFEWDLVTSRGRWNPQMTRVHGFTPEESEIDAEGWGKVFHPEDTPRLMKEAEVAFREKDNFEFEFRTVPPGGPQRWILSKGRVIRDEQGRAIRLIGTHSDITRRKMAEEALARGMRRQEALFRLADQLHRAKSLEDVYEATFDAILKGLGCDRASILLYDHTGVMRFVSWLGLSDAYRKATDGHSPWKVDEKNATPICMENVEVAELRDELRAVIRKEGIKALAFIPLMSRGKLIGKFMVYYNAPHVFREDEVELCQTIARQLAFGIERKRAEQAVRESEEHFREIVETTPECVKVVANDGTLLRMNASGLKMVGADSAEMVVGKSVYGLIAPEDRERFRAFNERVCAGEKGTLEFDIVGLDGTLRHMETHAAPLWNPDGSVAQLAVSRDVTKRKKAEEAQYRFAAIVESSDDAIISKDLKGIITSWNAGAERIFGFTAEEAIGKPVTIIIPAELHEEEKEILRRLRQGERIEHFETIRRTKHGTRRHISLTISPVQDAQGRVIGVSKIARDITQRKETEKLLREAELSGRLLQLQDEERRRIARELHDGAGQLLAALSMNVSAVIDEKDKLSSETAQRVEENAGLIEQLSSEIRTMSHLLHPPLLDEVGLQSALTEYVRGFEERSGIRVNLELPEKMERLPHEYELSLFRIVQECLTNIHRHSGSTTAVVRLRMSGAEIELEVLDQGRGISPEIQANFVAGKSSGVGLRGMRERVRQIGGSLRVESNERGTAVLVTLPFERKRGEESEKVAEEGRRNLRAQEKSLTPTKSRQG